MQDTLIQNSGRELRLVALRQALVYSGLLEGLPTRKVNDDHIECLLTDEGKKGSVHLITPKQTAIRYEGKYPFGEPASLPAVECVGYFESTGVDVCHRSYLTIVWFQNDYAFPIAAEQNAQIVSLDWNGLAQQVEL